MTFPWNNTVDNISETLTYRDAKGNTARNVFYMNTTGSSGTDDVITDWGLVETAWTALTNAAFQRAHGFFERYGAVQYGAHVSGGAYEAVIDKAVLVFQDVTGILHRWEVPAPKIAIFKADKITVDPTAVATFVGLMTTALPTSASHMCARNGYTIINYMGGFYKARKIRRRLDVLILQPDLTASLPAE